MLELLKKSGFEETEAKVYLAMLELGPATVSEITSKAAINRTLGYHVLKKLGWHGLVDGVSGKGKYQRYIAKHPRYLLQFVKNKKQSWERRLEEMTRGLPELVSLYKIAEKPVVRYQEGNQGVKNIYLETLESKTEILSILDLEDWETPEFYQFGKEYTKERSQRKIHERILVLDTPPGHRWMENYRGSFTYTHYRWIAPMDVPGILEFGGEMNIYENKVMMAITKEPHRIGIIIESTPLVNILKGMFELAWKVAKEPIKRKKVVRHKK